MIVVVIGLVVLAGLFAVDTGMAICSGRTRPSTTTREQMPFN